MFYGRNRGHIDFSQRQAMAHPTRKRIMELVKRDALRSLKADELLVDLLTEFPDLKAAELRPPQVAYHLAVLRDAELLPTR